MMTLTLDDVCEFYSVDCDPWDIGTWVNKMWTKGFDLFRDPVPMSETDHECEATGLMTRLFRYTLLFRRRPRTQN